MLTTLIETQEISMAYKNQTREHQVNAGKGDRKHGCDSMQANPLSAWAVDDRTLALKVAEELETRELAELHVRLLAGKAYAMLEALTGYISKQFEAGVDVEELPSFTRWPAFFNSYAKALKMSLELTKDQPPSRKLIDYEGDDDK